MRYCELLEGRVYQIDWGYLKPVPVISNPSPPQARTLVEAIRKRREWVYIRGLMAEWKIYVWDGWDMTHDDVRLELLPDMPAHSSDLATFEVQDYTQTTGSMHGALRHPAKLTTVKAGDFDPSRSPFLRNVMLAIDSPSGK